MRTSPNTLASQTNPTIALTGASGFIGSALARRLHAAGWRVRALVRAGSKRAELTASAAELVEGALEDEASLQRLVAGTAAVIHCAGVVRGVTRADFDRVNAAGVARLAQVAAAQQQAPRFLLISSLAAREPGLSHYAASKHRGELALAEAAGEMQWTALRPPAVYGPGDRELLPLFVWIGRGIAPVLGSSGARFSLIYVEDLAAAVISWLESERCERRVFELHDGRQGGYDWDDVIDIAGRLLGRRILRVPVRGLAAVAALNLAAARIFGYAPMLTPGKLREFKHPDWVCDDAALRQALDWAPRVELEEGLRRTLGWGNTAAA